MNTVSRIFRTLPLLFFHQIVQRLCLTHTRIRHPTVTTLLFLSCPLFHLTFSRKPRQNIFLVATKSSTIVCITLLLHYKRIKENFSSRQFT